MAAGQWERPQARRRAGAGANDHEVGRLREGKDGQERSDPVRAVPPADGAAGVQVGVVAEWKREPKRPAQLGVLSVKGHSLLASSDAVRSGPPMC